MADVVAIKVRADAKQATKALKDLGGVFGNLDRAMKSPVAMFAAAAAGLAAVGVAAAAAGLALVKSAADTAKTGDQIAKSARIVGTSAEQFQVLAFAAERSGVSMASVEKGLKRLAKSMFDAKTVGGVTADTFEGMGIAIEDVDGNLRDTEDVFRDIADRIKAVGVNTQTSAELMAIGGRRFADLTEILQGGSEGLLVYEARLKAVGGIMSDDLLASSEAFEDSITDLDKALLGLKANIAESVLPGLTDFVNFTTEILVPELKELASVVKTVGGNMLDDLRPALEMIGDMLTGRGFGSTRRSLDTLKAIRDIGGGTDETPAPSAPGGGRRVGRVEPTEENFPAVFGAVAAAEEAQRMITQAAIEGAADRWFWERDALAVSKALKDQAEAEDIARQERAIQRAQDLANAQTQAASAAFGAVETFAGMAQTAVEDSYFGQTAAGRAAAKALFVAGKAAALANAIVNTAQAVTNALAVQPYPLGAALAVSAGIAGGAQIGTIVGTTIQGIADAGLAPGALRAAGLNQHTAIAVGPNEAVIDPRGTSEISRMLELQRRQMEMASMGGANEPARSPDIYLDGRRVTRALGPSMTAALENGNDFRRNVRTQGVG